MLRDVENLARRLPWLFAASGLALGLVASRFLKASSGGRYRSQQDLGSRRGYVSPADSEPEVVLGRTSRLDSPVGCAPWRNGEPNEPRDQSVGELLKDRGVRADDAHAPGDRPREDGLAEKGRKAGPGFGMWGAAGIAGLLALGSLTAFFILALDGVMPNWLAALIVAAAYGVIAAVLYMTGKQRVEEADPRSPRRPSRP